MEFRSERVKNTAPYVAGEQPRDRSYIKLNTNENPYPPAPAVADALNRADAEELRKYPDPDATALREAIAAHCGVLRDRVFVGNGSDEVLAFTVAAFFDPGDRVAFADYTYSFYPVYAAFFGIEADVVPLRDFRLAPEDYFKRDAKGIVLCNPNAPTGTAVATAEIEKILLNNPDKLVVVDEAYADFAKESALPLSDRFQNLLIIRTFSKSYALAGARLGYAIGDPALIETLNRVKNSFNSYTVNCVTQALGIAALSEGAYFREHIDAIVKTRDRAAAALRDMGFRTLPSDANFLFVEVGDGKKYYTALKARGILVRFFDKPVLNRFLRVTVGTDFETDAFLKEIADLKTRAQ